MEFKFISSDVGSTEEYGLACVNSIRVSSFVPSWFSMS
jgi:hypothetical protein